MPADAMHMRLMLMLTFTTGINDAVGYLGLDRVFTGNMTGNVVVLGMALVGNTGLPVLGPGLALVGFIVGAALGGRVLRSDVAGWSRRTTMLFGLVAVLQTALYLLLLAAGGRPVHGVIVMTTTAAACGMGIQAATARKLAVKDISTVVVTSTLTSLAADGVFGSNTASWRGGGTLRRLAAIVVISLGAFAGALLLQVQLGVGLLLAGVLNGGVAFFGSVHARLVRRSARAQFVTHT
ncbi:YoaK family protein [Nocardia sp. NPDC050408]|uniref:YoaK family protein n=1 Tax=Nocardia sp. NPDC050408 TaxID=3364319 RepID=UPI003789CE1B